MLPLILLAVASVLVPSVGRNRHQVPPVWPIQQARATFETRRRAGWRRREGAGARKRKQREVTRHGSGSHAAT